MSLPEQLPTLRERFQNDFFLPAVPVAHSLEEAHEKAVDRFAHEFRMQYPYSYATTIRDYYGYSGKKTSV